MTIRRLKGRTLKSSSVVLAAAAALLAGASFAWACTVSAHIQASRMVGRAGSEITVLGKDFAPGAPVEIRWNSVDGPVVATASGPSFSVPVKVPSVAPDVYYIVAVTKKLSESQITHGWSGRASTTFEVQPGVSEASPARTHVQTDLWTGFTSQAEVPQISGTNSGTDPNPARAGSFVVGGVLLAVGAMALAFTVIARPRRKARTSRR